MEEDDEEAMGPVAMAFVLVPLVDFFVYYKINDFNTASTSEWTNAANACLAGGAIKLVGIAAYMALGDALPIAAISVVHEIAALYLINTADGVLTSSDVNMYYGGAAFGLVLSAAKAVMMMGDSEDDEEVADDYYGEDYGAEEPAVEETTGGDASGDYGYY
jgi:predicted Kef-type K+ transport protein